MEAEDLKNRVRDCVLVDADQISRELFDGRPLGTILDVRMADRLDDEFRPYVVECEAGRFLYKPRDLRFEDAFGKLAVSLFGDDVRAPRYATFENYGYVEFVLSQPMPVVTDKPHLLSYRTGKLHALFHALGRMDLSGKNIAAWDNTPVLIDVEVCLDPKQHPMYVVQKRVEMEAQRNEMLRELLDSPFRGGAGWFAFGGMPKRIIEGLMPCKRGENADDGTESVAVVPLGLKSYIRGYREGWDICLEHRAQLVDFVKSCKDWTIRVVLPCGSPAQQLLALSLESEGGAAFSSEIDAAVLEELTTNVALLSAQKKGPIYRAKVDGRTLYDVRSGREYPNFFAESALDNTLAHLERAHADQAKLVTSFLLQQLSV